MQEISLFWFRRDLRLYDNAGLYHALKNNKNVLPIFIFDENILNKLPGKDRRVVFIHQQITRLKNELQKLSSDLKVIYDTPLQAFEKLTKEYTISAVYTNHDYEPYAIEREKNIQAYLKEKSIQFHTFKDQVIFEKSEITKDDGLPYTVYTPYSKKWKAALNDFYRKPYPTHTYFNHLYKINLKENIPTLQTMGFDDDEYLFPTTQTNIEVLKNYHTTRDIPSIDGTSQLSIHLRFGTISIRSLTLEALQNNEKYLNELIWRDFYQQILWHFPHVVSSSFKPQYDAIQWRNNEDEFKAWCNGNTGYPIVDAGMRELNTTGWMHNRVRMIVASFLTKHLLIDWRWGEAYFAEKLNDFDLASNNGGWQWAAGTGVDASPYFRIFNPRLQTEKFDPELKYIKKWVPEFEDFSYSKPIVVHEFARDRCLQVYKVGLGK
jgi:deoxyribodipyrimidine photo-lyase